MKKSELKNMKPFVVSRNIVRLVREDDGEEIKPYWRAKPLLVYQRYRYYMAEVENEILKVGVFTRKHIAKGQKCPDFTIYIDKKTQKWTTYNHADGKWLTAMITNLPYCRETGESYAAYGYCSRRETKIINRYLEQKGEAKKVIRDYQFGIRDNERKQRHRSETEKIDEVMEQVPKLPKDFESWIKKSAYKNNAYMIYNISPEQKGYCTHCEKEVKLKTKPRHNEKGKCPRCRAEVTYKSRKKQQILQDSKHVGIIKPLKDKTGYILRVFCTKIKYRQETEYKNTEFWMHEKYRFRLNKNFYLQEIFEYGEYKNTGVIRWCHEKRKGFYGEPASTYCVLYEKNTVSLLKDTEGQYVPIKQLFQRNKGTKCDAEEVLRKAVEYPALEKLIKLGMDRLVIDIFYCHSETLDLRGSRPEEILKLNKVYRKIAVEMDVNQRELRVVQSAYRAEVTVSKELLQRAMPYLEHRSIEDNILFWKDGKVEKTINYFEKLHREKEVNRTYILRDYEDYKSQLQKLHMPLNRTNRFPQDFYEAHAELSRLIREKEDAVKALKIKEQNKLLKKQVKELKKLYYVNSKEFVIVFPESKQDFVTEGQKQHNCVGGYFERMVLGKTTVFFLRRKEEPDTPFCTVEFVGGKLIQCRTSCNKDAPEEVGKLMEQITKNYQKAITERNKEDGRNQKELSGIQKGA